MKIVIQNKKSQLFWKQEADWIADPQQAHDFPTTALAQKFCQDQQWSDVQVVIKFDKINDLVLPIP